MKRFLFLALFAVGLFGQVTTLPSGGGGAGADDQTAAEVANTPSGNIEAVTVQAAITELDSEKQAADPDLTAIAALSLVRGGIVYGSGAVPAWTMLSPGTAGFLLIMGANEPAWTAVPTWNQNTTGTAAGLTAQYVDWAAGSGGASIANKPTLGTAAAATLGTGAGQVPVTGEYEPNDADLTAIAALSCTENQIIKRNGVGAWVCAADETGEAGSGDITDVGDCTGPACFTALGSGTTLTFHNATSGTIALTPVAGALGTVTLNMPAADGTLARLSDIPATVMTQTTENDTDNTVSRAVGTSGRAFEKTGVSIDDNNIITAAGYRTTAGSTAGLLGLLQGTACTPETNEVCVYAPASVTAYGLLLPGAVGSTGVVKVSVSGSVATYSHAALASTELSDTSSVSRIIYAGTKALDTDEIASEGCDTMTQAATGVASTDVISFTPNGDVTAVTGYAPVTEGGLAIYLWPTENQINIKVCNPTDAAITPGAVSLNLRVTR